MADSKITALLELPTPIGTDIINVVDDPGGTPISKKSTLANVLAVQHDHAASDITSGQLILEQGGTEADLSATGPGALVQSSSGAAVTVETTLAHERGGLEADVSAYAGVPLITGGATSEIKYNMAAAVAPDADDDTGDGYTVGSQWFDTTADRAYVCLDATATAAVWGTISADIGARVYKSTDTTIPTGTVTALEFPSERFDTDGMHDTITNPERLTCNTSGKYLISGSISFPSNATGVRGAYIRINGTLNIGIVFADTVASGFSTSLVITSLWDLDVGDYVVLSARQTSGGDLDLESVQAYSQEFTMQRID